MNEVLAKRLLGACVLVGATIVLSNLLPAPQALPPEEEHAKRVTYDLRPEVEVAKIEPPPVSPPAPAEAEVVPAPVPQPAAEPAPPPKSAPAPVEVPKPKPKPVATKPAKVAAAPALQPAAPAVVEPAPAPVRGPDWYVQIGAYAFEANAAKSVAKLSKAGLQPHQDVIAMKAGKRFRVRCGPFGSQDEAEAQKTKAVQAGFTDARVARD